MECNTNNGNRWISMVDTFYICCYSKVKDELAKSKENMALTYATKDDVKDDMSQLMQRFDRLESKIDDMIRRAAEK